MSWSHHLTLNSAGQVCMRGKMVLLMLFTCRQTVEKQTKSKGLVQWSNRKKELKKFFCFSSELKEAGVVQISTGFGFSALLRRLQHGGQLFVQQTGDNKLPPNPQLLPQRLSSCSLELSDDVIGGFTASATNQTLTLQKASATAPGQIKAGGIGCQMMFLWSQKMNLESLVVKKCPITHSRVTSFLC